MTLSLSEATAPTKSGAGSSCDEEAIGTAIVRRLRESIERENAAVRRFEAVDYEACNQEKARGVLEIRRLLQSAAGPRPAGLSEALRALESALEENERLLRVQLAAAKAVTELIAQAIRDAQSDGTYRADGGPDFGG